MLHRCTLTSKKYNTLLDVIKEEAHTLKHTVCCCSLSLFLLLVGPCLTNAWGSPTYGNTKYEIPLVRYTLATLRKSRKNRIILEVHEALFTLEQKQNSLSCLCLKPKNCKTRRKKKRAVAIFALAIDASSAYSRIFRYTNVSVNAPFNGRAATELARGGRGARARSLFSLSPVSLGTFSPTAPLSLLYTFTRTAAQQRRAFSLLGACLHGGVRSSLRFSVASLSQYIIRYEYEPKRAPHHHRIESAERCAVHCASLGVICGLSIYLYTYTYM